MFHRRGLRSADDRLQPRRTQPPDLNQVSFGFHKHWHLSQDNSLEYGGFFQKSCGKFKIRICLAGNALQKKQTQQAGGGCVLAEAARQRRPTLMTMSESTPAQACSLLSLLAPVQNQPMFHRRGLFRLDRRFFRSEPVRLPGRGVLNFRIGSTVFGRGFGTSTTGQPS